MTKQWAPRHSGSGRDSASRKQKTRHREKASRKEKTLAGQRPLWSGSLRLALFGSLVGSAAAVYFRQDGG